MRAAIYTRLSLDRTGEQLGVDRQEKACQKIASDHGWSVVETYSDNSVSAFDPRKRRPEYERLRNDYAAGRFQALIVWDLDRLTRQPRQLEDWLEDAETRGLLIATATGEEDVLNHDGRMMLRIKAAVNRSEMEKKGARQRLSNKQRAEKGLPISNRRPFGFEQDGITHRLEEAEVVRWMYADYLAGVSQRQIARKLNDMGVTSTSGKPWSQARLRSFLRTPRNGGLATYQGEVIGPGAWDPLVSRDTWEAAVAKMDRNAADMRATGQPRDTRRKYLLVGVARCGVCGSNMKTTYNTQGGRMYRCKSEPACLHRKAESLEKFVETFVMRLIQREGIRSTPGATAGDRGKLLAEADALRDRKEQLVEDYADGTLSKAELRVAKDRIESRLAVLEDQMLAVAEVAALRPLLEAEDIEQAWQAMDVPRRRAAIDALVNVVVLKTPPGANRFMPEYVSLTPKG